MQYFVSSRSPAPLRIHRAAAPRPAGPRAAGPRVVYFVASHVNPDQIVRLARACRSGSPNSRVLLHHDYAVSDLDPKRLEAIGNVDLLPADSPVGWGGFHICSAAIRSLKWLLDNRDFDWVVHLSGQCYPVQPVEQIERQLGDSPHDGYMSMAPVDEVPWEVGPMRYLYRYYELPKFRGWSRLRSLIDAHADRRLRAGRLPRMWVSREKAFRIGLRPLAGPFDKSFPCYKGSTWWTLNHRSIRYLIDHLDENPGLVRHYRRSQFAPNESLFQTVLRNAPDLDLVSDDQKRYINWSHPETGHPDLLGVEHFDEMIGSGAFFARKFDMHHDHRVLDMLDEYIGVTAARACAA